MRDSVFSHAAKSQKRVQRECVRRCGDDLHRKLPLFLMFIPDVDGRPCTSWWGRYRTAQSLRTIRKLASSAVEDSPTRFWMLRPHERARLQMVHRTSVEGACRVAHPPETDDYRRCAEYCAQYVFVAFYEGGMVPLQLYKKLRVKHAFLYVPLELYNQVCNQVKVLLYIQVFEALGAKRILYKKHNHSDEEAGVSGGVQVQGVEASVEHRARTTSLLATSREMTYEKNTDFTFHVRQLLDRLDAHPRCYFSLDDYHGDIELQYVLHSRVKEFMTHYSRFFKVTRSVSSEVTMQLCIADLHQNLGLHAHVQHRDARDDVFYVHVEFYTVAELCDANEVPTNLAGFSLLTRMRPSDVDDTDFLQNNLRSFYDRFVRERGGDAMLSRHHACVASDGSYRRLYNSIQSFYDVQSLFERLHATTEPWESRGLDESVEVLSGVVAGGRYGGGGYTSKRAVGCVSV
jgi:hypothetical protein